MKIQSILISVLSLGILQAQEDGPHSISICYEAFSLPLAMAAKLQREQLPDPDLYARLVAAVEKQTVKQETITVLRCMSGQKATDESISEQIYPTEFRPARLLKPVAASVSPSSSKNEQTPVPDAKDAANPSASAGLRIPATPEAFDTRNTGTTLEFEPIMTEGGGKFVDLRIVPEHVTAVGRTSFGQDISTTEMPVFEAQRTNTSVTVRINRPFLLSTINRPPVSQVDPDSANRVWFAFVTATIPRP